MPELQYRVTGNDVLPELQAQVLLERRLHQPQADVEVGELLPPRPRGLEAAGPQIR